MDEQKRQKAMARRKRKDKKRNERQHRYQAQPKQRTCGGCRMCCYVFCVPELAKERRQWCRYVSQDGCSLHDKERPPVCTGYTCVWLDHPEIPERYRPDRIGCVASDRGNRFVHVCQVFKGAAKRRDATTFIDSLVDSGVRVLITWEQGDEREHRLRCDRSLYPTAPTRAELLGVDPDLEKRIRDVKCFEDPGESPCLWQPGQALTG
jgi:hypothetical protein